MSGAIVASCGGWDVAWTLKNPFYPTDAYIGILDHLINSLIQTENK